ncbi:hypothetical protein [Streptomyces sp. AS02]|uniref:hypothetical protein n=1 Tax=Streptomyces sp. AS02 TaxID=2938946 RepID=UPI00202062B3|nr:hypothetical protein [Streptomyces sp. AS02]MCL8015637.1 hypothetical protein [Streptomyces sp. AS02]
MRLGVEELHQPRQGAPGPGERHVYLGDPLLDPLMETLNDLGAMVFTTRRPRSTPRTWACRPSRTSSPSTPRAHW